MQTTSRNDSLAPPREASSSMSQEALVCQDVTVSQFSEPGNSHEHLGGVTGIDRPLIRATGNCQSTLFLLQDTVRRGRWIAPDKLGQLLRWARDGVGCFDGECGECGDRERRVVGRARSPSSVRSVGFHVVTRFSPKPALDIPSENCPLRETEPVRALAGHLSLGRHVSDVTASRTVSARLAPVMMAIAGETAKISASTEASAERWPVTRSGLSSATAGPSVLSGEYAR